MFSGPRVGGPDDMLDSVTGRQDGFLCVQNHLVVSDSVRPHGLWLTRLLCAWNFLGKNTGVGCHALLKGTLLTQGWNLRLLRLLHWQGFIATSASWEALLS